MSILNRNKTYIIAEAGSNFNQDLDMAKKLVITAKECGADAIKFQLFKASVLYPEKILQRIQLQKRMNFQGNG